MEPTPQNCLPSASNFHYSTQQIASDSRATPHTRRKPRPVASPDRMNRLTVHQWVQIARPQNVFGVPCAFFGTFARLVLQMAKPAIQTVIADHPRIKQARRTEAVLITLRAKGAAERLQGFLGIRCYRNGGGGG